jgi:hypothetical protein
MTWKNAAGITITALALAASTGDARANLVVNGGFEQTTNGVGQLVFATNAIGWTSPDYSFPNTGYNFIFAFPSADTTGSPGYHGNVALYGPGNGFNNGLMPSPNHGNFIGADGDTRYNGRIEQTINGLTPGGTYALSFDWAGAQMAGAGGMPNEMWQVSLGSQTFTTPNMPLPYPGGFTGWTLQTFYFTPTSASEVLSFLATEGGPFGGPPFLLLDGVTLDAVPEPSTVVLAGAGLLGLGVVRRLRKRSGSASA